MEDQIGPSLQTSLSQALTPTLALLPSIQESQPQSKPMMAQIMVLLPSQPKIFPSSASLMRLVLDLWEDLVEEEAAAVMQDMEEQLEPITKIVTVPQQEQPAPLVLGTKMEWQEGEEPLPEEVILVLLEQEGQEESDLAVNMDNLEEQAPEVAMAPVQPMETPPQMKIFGWVLGVEEQVEVEADLVWKISQPQACHIMLFITEAAAAEEAAQAEMVEVLSN